MDSKRGLMGCRGASQGGVLGLVIAALIVWFLVQGVPAHGGGSAAFLAQPGRKAAFVLGLLFYGPVGFFVGSIIGAVIASLRIRSTATRKSVADEPGPEINGIQSQSHE
jgi:hypothetical protein